MFGQTCFKPSLSAKQTSKENTKLMRKLLITSPVLVLILFRALAPLYTVHGASELWDVGTDEGTALGTCKNTCVLADSCILSSGQVIVHGLESRVIQEKLASFQLRSIREGTLPIKPSGLAHNARGFSKSAVFIDRYVEKNCGHILGDEVWPIFRLILKHNRSLGRNDTLDLYIDRQKIARCDDYFIPLIKGRVFTFRNTSTLSVEQHCYRKLYFGTSGLSYVDDDTTYLSSMQFSDDVRRFRDMFFHEFRIRESKIKKTLVMQKKYGEHLVAIENIDELKNAAATEFSDTQVQIISWDDYSVAEQIGLMAQTKFFISLPGADVMNAIFLPDDAILVVFCRYFKGRMEHSNEIRLWYRFVRHLRVFEFCGQEDVVLQPSGNVWVNTSVLGNLER